MKAIVYTKYGPPDVLQPGEVAKPAPRDNEVLIRIFAAVVTPADCAFQLCRERAQKGKCSHNFETYQQNLTNQGELK